MSTISIIIVTCAKVSTIYVNINFSGAYVSHLYHTTTKTKKKKSATSYYCYLFQCYRPLKNVKF